MLLAAAGTSIAEVNCKQVNKYLQTGRTVKDVAETMVISESDVRKCQESAGAAKPAEGAPAEPKGAEAGQQAK
jgi:hypothetical protein